MIHVSNLNKHYPSVKALDNITFDISPSEIVGILGPNGAGKTTLMNILSCITTPTSGTVYVNDSCTNKAPLSVKYSIGYMPEDNPLYVDMTVLDYLNFVANMRLIPKHKIKVSIDYVVDTCQLSSVLNKKIKFCSKGFRQRIGLAQCIIHHPKVLLLDEPTNGLDPEQIIEIRDLIKSLKLHTTILICSHNLTEIMSTCSRAIVLYNGRIIADGEPSRLNSQADYVTSIETNIDYDTLFSLLKDTVSIQSLNLISIGDKFHVYHLHTHSDCRDLIYKVFKESSYLLLQLSLVNNQLENTYLNLLKDLNHGC